ncbi:stimulated by retinoic acid gene 6 protein-like isoform X1 [Ascaphus truei]|uniref:stimulated by retinoic acid gene 6 protein-like isoform X1 n=1 Tax=Ascaphus truei TaxID=8439 RepID=UPI003F5A7D5C
METSSTSRTFTMANETRAPSADRCLKSIHMDLFVHCSLVPAVLITFLLSYLQQRAKHQTADTLPLGKRFGIVVPVNFISSFSNRWSYGAACGATATTVFLLFFNEYSNYFSFTAPPWAKALVYLLSALEVGMDYYPFFACLSTDHRLVGSALGFCYALFWFCVQLADVCECQKIANATASIYLLLIPVPSLVCCLFLMGRFVHIFVGGVIAHRRSEKTQEEEPLLPEHQANYVKLLLTGACDTGTDGSFVSRKIYTWDPCFKFPTRMIVTAVLCLICLYNFVLVDFYLSPKAVVDVDKWTLAMVNISYANRTKRILHMLKESWFYSTFPSVFTSVIYVFHVMASYRNQMRRMYRGTSAVSPPSGPAAILAASIRYTGSQVAYLLWGYFLLHILFFVISLMITFWFIVPIQEGNGLLVLQGLGYTVLGISLMATVVVAQILAAQFLFLQDKISPTDRSKPLAINNRRAFQNFSYFFMFYSVIMGFGACLVRVILNVFLGSWLLARIDRPLFPRGYEGVDMGYSTWIGMLQVDLFHTHPVVLSFCHFLIQDSVAQKKPTNPDGLQECRRKQWRTKWHLAYTLVNNPALILSRKQSCGLAASFPQSQEALERLLIATVRSRK